MAAKNNANTETTYLCKIETAVMRLPTLGCGKNITNIQENERKIVPYSLAILGLNTDQN